MQLIYLINQKDCQKKNIKIFSKNWSSIKEKKSNVQKDGVDSILCPTNMNFGQEKDLDFTKEYNMSKSRISGEISYYHLKLNRIQLRLSHFVLFNHF